MADLDVEKRIRRLRKKLIQISNLEILPRELNSEELIKVDKKDQLRSELQSLLRQFGDPDMKRKQNTEQAPELKTSPTKVKKSSGSGGERRTSGRSSRSSFSNSTSQLQTQQQTTTQSSQQSQASEQENEVPTLQHQQQDVGEAGNVGQVVTPAVVDDQAVDVGADVPTTSVPASRSTAVVTSSTDPVVAGCIDHRVLAGSSSAAKKTSSKSSSVNTSTPRANVSAPRPENRNSEVVKLWRQRNWTVEELEGHEDRVLGCDIDVENSLVVTCSSDTTVKVWDLHTGVLTHSLRGHTGPVTGARILRWRHERHSQGEEGAGSAGQDAEEPPANQDLHSDLLNSKIVVVSASVDCSLKIWRLEDCRAVSSIYTYNGISKLCLIKKLQYSVSGTDGGKLEVYNLTTGKLVSSQTMHHEPITALSVHENEDKIMMASGSSDGIIKVFQVLEDRLRCLFVSENVCSISTDTSIHTRPVSALHITGCGTVYYGDNGHNLKMLDWRHNRVHKFANHTSDQGFTDHITGTEDVMMATGYDVDTGCGQINIYRPRVDQIPQYLATLSDNQTDRISVMCVEESSRGDVFLVSGGYDLKIWKSQRSRSGTTSRDASTNIQGCILSLGDDMLVDSGTDPDSDLEDRAPDTTRPDLGHPDKPAAGFCNCVVS